MIRQVPYRVMYLGSCWGNAIYYLDNSHERIYGYKDPLSNDFHDGSVMFDIINHYDDDVIPLYLVTNKKRCNNPRDMFFADIYLIGHVKNPYNYQGNWYHPYIGDLLEEYKKMLRKLFVKHRRRIKKIVLVLKLMNE